MSPDAPCPHRSPIFHRAALACAGFCIVAGAGCAATWIPGVAGRMAPRAGLGMDVDAALGFLLAGCALLAARTGKPAAAALAAGCLLALGNLVLLEGLRVSPGLAHGAHAGPLVAATMPAPLALCFVGAAVAVLGCLREARAPLAAAVASLVCAWGAMATLGYSVDLELLYGRSGIGRMAFASAVTITVLSAGVLCAIVSDSIERTPRMVPDWLHVPAGVFTGAGGLILWHATTSRLLERQVRPIDAGSDAMLVVAAGAAVLMAGVVRLWLVSHRRKTQLEQMHRDLQRTNTELLHAAAEIKALSGLIPICAWCKSIRGDEGYWEQLEHYWASHADVLFTHGICPSCAEDQVAP